MKISTSAISLFRHFGAETAMNILSEAGFEAIDIFIPQVLEHSAALAADDTSCCRRIRQMAADRGLEIYQTHAAFPLAECDAVRSIYASAELGCRNLVFHPVLHPDFDNGLNPEKAKQANWEFFSALVPALRDTGVTACIENLFRGENGKPKIYNACSGAEDLTDLLDSLSQAHGSHFAACLDTGHAAVVGQDPAAMLRTLGARTRVLHLHDNDGILDQHWLPGIGVIHWDDVINAIREIGFTGAFNTEVSTVFKQCTQEGTCDIQNAVKVSRELYQHCRKLADKI